MDLSNITDPERLSVLDRLAIMGTPDEPEYDRLTGLAARCFQSAWALIVLLDDHQAFVKSTQGQDPPWGDGRSFPFMKSWCRFVVGSEAPMAVDDARVHPLVRDSDYVDGGALAYLGVPLVVAGKTLGALCVVERSTRPWTDDDIQLLNSIATCVANEMALRRALKDAVAAQMTLRGYVARYKELSMTDAMTELYNRRAFLELGTQTLEVAEFTRDVCSLFYIDVDGLKAVNDTLGHEVGDQLIVEASKVLRDCFRGSDVVARLGGDEFAVLAVGCSTEGARVAQERLARAVAQANRQAGRSYELSLSVGSTPVHGLKEPLQSLLRDADARMYETKSARRRASGVYAAPVHLRSKLEVDESVA